MKCAFLLAKDSHDLPFHRHGLYLKISSFLGRTQPHTRLVSELLTIVSYPMTPEVADADCVIFYSLLLCHESLPVVLYIVSKYIGSRIELLRNVSRNWCVSPYLIRLAYGSHKQTPKLSWCYNLIIAFHLLTVFLQKSIFVDREVIPAYEFPRKIGLYLKQS